jgi:hypothetical protein
MAARYERKCRSWAQQERSIASVSPQVCSAVSAQLHVAAVALELRVVAAAVSAQLHVEAVALEQLHVVAAAVSAQLHVEAVALEQLHVEAVVAGQFHVVAVLLEQPRALAALSECSPFAASWYAGLRYAALSWPLYGLCSHVLAASLRHFHSRVRLSRHRSCVWCYVREQPCVLERWCG